MTSVNLGVVVWQETRPPAPALSLVLDRLVCKELQVGEGPRRVVIKATPDWCGVQVDGNDGRHVLMADVPAQEACFVGTWKGGDRCNMALISGNDGLGQLQFVDAKGHSLYVNPAMALMLRGQWMAAEQKEFDERRLRELDARQLNDRLEKARQLADRLLKEK